MTKPVRVSWESSGRLRGQAYALGLVLATLPLLAVDAQAEEPAVETTAPEVPAGSSQLAANSAGELALETLGTPLSADTLADHSAAGVVDSLNSVVAAGTDPVMNTFVKPLTDIPTNARTNRYSPSTGLPSILAGQAVDAVIPVASIPRRGNF